MGERFWRLLFDLPRFREQSFQTYETTRPWVNYTYFVPDWLTRILGRTSIRVGCSICGEVRFPTLRMPRFGPVPDQGHHPVRSAFLGEHQHPGVNRNPLSWERPLENMAALQPGDLEDVFGIAVNRAQRAARPTTEESHEHE